VEPQVYVVGGAVRDLLLGREPKDYDYVVVGASESYMLDQGYKRVGEFFPVFLHPTENKEYALARKERKVASGHTGFECEVDDVTLEEDLYRRDLTINAIAVHENNIDLLDKSKPVIETFALFDPYNGYKDLNDRILRHVSPAFKEDPLRVLRVARFAARYSDFSVAHETLEIMREVVDSGELLHLSPERVWKEFSQVLECKYPSTFFYVLESVGAIQQLMPEMYESSWFTADDKEVGSELKFALLLKDTCSEAINSLCEYLKVPLEYRELALMISKHHKMWPKTTVSQASEIALQILKEIDAFRRPMRVKLLRYAAELIGGRDSQIWNCARALEECYDVCCKISFNDVDKSLTGKDIGLAIDRLRRVEVLMYFSNGHNGKITTG